MITHTIRRFAVIGAVGAFAALPVHAALLTYEGFNYTNGSNITGQNGGTGWRSGGSWANLGTTGTISSSGSSYVSAGYSAGQLTNLPTSGNAAIAGGNQRFLAIDAGTVYDSPTFDIRDGGNRFGGGSVGAAGAINGISLYGSFLVTSSNWSTGEMGFELNDNGNVDAVNTNFRGGASGISLRTGNNISQSSASAALTGSNTYLVVWRLDFSSSANGDNLTFWLNPTGGAAEPSGGIGLTSTKNITFNNIILRSYAGNVVFDEIRLGTTWSDVAPSAIPEPSAFAALAGVGVLGLAAVRRRRRI